MKVSYCKSIIFCYIILIGQQATIGKHTVQTIKMKPGNEPEDTAISDGGSTMANIWRRWEGNSSATEEGSQVLTVTITPHAQTMVGTWSLAVHTWKIEGTNDQPGEITSIKRKINVLFIVLFNPWCKGTFLTGLLL